LDLWFISFCREEKMKNKIRLLLQHSIPFQNMPSKIKEKTIYTFFWAAFVLVFGIISSLIQFRLLECLISLIMVFLLFIIFYIQIYAPFAMNKVLFYDGVIVKKKNSFWEEKGKNSKFAKKVISRYIIPTYTLEIMEKEHIEVVLQDIVNGQKAVRKLKEGSRIRVFTLPKSICKKWDGSYLIEKVLLTEVLE